MVAGDIPDRGATPVVTNPDRRLPAQPVQEPEQVHDYPFLRGVLMTIVYTRSPISAHVRGNSMEAERAERWRIRSGFESSEG